MPFIAIYERLGFARLLLLAGLLLLAVAPIGRASAQDYTACYDSNNYGTEAPYNPKCPTREIAYSEAKRICELRSSMACSVNAVSEGFAGVRFRTTATNSYTTSRGWVTGCPAGTEWFESEQKCLQPCLDRNPSTPPNYGYWTLSNAGTSMCKSGCSFSRGDILETRGFQVCGSGQCTSGASQVRAVWSYDGAKCSSQPTDPPPPADNEVSCTPATANQTYCIRPNGENCYTASSGRMICWKPSEQGTKTDGTVTQTNNVGDEQPNPPPGSQHTATVKTSTSTTTNTVTTTTNTYTTTSGAPAGATNEGTSLGTDGKPPATGGGSGSGTGGTGDGSGDDNSAAGGGNCDTPPITSGDAILGMVATQTWATRCAVEAGNAAKVTGDISDCKVPFTVEGTNANAVKLRGIREQICGPGSVANAGDVFDAESVAAVADANGEGDTPPDDEPADPLAGSKVERDGNWLLDKLDASGFLGGGSCPPDTTIAVGNGSIKLSLGPICTMLAAVSGLVLALAYLIAFRIMAS